MGELIGLFVGLFIATIVGLAIMEGQNKMINQINKECADTNGTINIDSYGTVDCYIWKYVGYNVTNSPVFNSKEIE